MHPHHRSRGERIRLAFCDGETSLALELSRTEDSTSRSASARVQSIGPATLRWSSRASSAVSSGLAGHCLAETAVKGKRSR
jgi:hypothetical protein